MQKQPLSKQQTIGLVAMFVAVLVIANDFTALSVALPAIEIAFSSDVTTVQWVITGYTLVFGVLIVTGGRLADMFGRRRIFFIGACIFAGFSMLAGLATDVWMLIIARGLMGVGGALMWPAVLGMTYSLLPPGREALGGSLIMTACGIGNSVGPLLGGALTDSASWRWIFFLNLPVALLAMLITWRVVEKDNTDSARERVDYAGVITLSTGLLALLYVLDIGTDLGWLDGKVIGIFILSAVALLLFAIIERRAGDGALMPRDVFTNTAFMAAGIATLLISAIFFASLLYLPQFMSKELGFSAMKSGAGLLPMMGVFAVVSFISGSLYERLGARLIISLGAILLAVGMYLLSMLQVASGYVGMVPGMVVLGIGTALFYSSITTAAITAVDDARASLAGAIVYMFQVAGGSIGLGVNTALVVTGATFVKGIQTAFLLDVVLAICGLLVVIFFVGGRLKRGQWHKLVHRHRAHG